MDFSLIPILASTFALGIVFGLAVDARARRRMQAELRDLQRQMEELNRQYDELDEIIRQQPDPTGAGTMTPFPHWHRHRTPLILALEGMTAQGQQAFIDNLAASRVLQPAPPNLFGHPTTSVPPETEAAPASETSDKPVNIFD